MNFLLLLHKVLHSHLERDKEFLHLLEARHLQFESALKLLSLRLRFLLHQVLRPLEHIDLINQSSDI